MTEIDSQKPEAETRNSCWSLDEQRDKTMAKKDTRVVKPRIGHVKLLRKHQVERDRKKYHRPSAKRVEAY